MYIIVSETFREQKFELLIHVDLINYLFSVFTPGLSLICFITVFIFKIFSLRLSDIFLQVILDVTC